MCNPRVCCHLPATCRQGVTPLAVTRTSSAATGIAWAHSPCVGGSAAESQTTGPHWGRVGRARGHTPPTLGGSQSRSPSAAGTSGPTDGPRCRGLPTPAQGACSHQAQGISSSSSSCSAFLHRIHPAPRVSAVQNFLQPPKVFQIIRSNHLNFFLKKLFFKVR